MSHASIPQDIEAEKGVLSSLFKSPMEVMEVLRQMGIDKDWFYISSHQRLYSAVSELIAKNTAIDFVTLASKLRSDATLDECGSLSYITELWSYVPTAANVAHYAELVREKWILRSVLSSCEDVMESVYASGTAQEASSELEIASAMVGMRMRGKKRRLSTSSVVDELMRKVYCGKKEELFGLPTGFELLDKAIGGIMKGDLILIQGERGSGKSAFALNIAERYDRKHGLGCTYCTFEMTAEQQVKRLIQLRSGRNIRDVLETQSEMFEEDPIAAIEKAANSVRKGKIEFFDAKPATITDCISELRRRAGHGDLGLGVLDYDELLNLQLGKGKSKEEALSEIASEWKNIGGELSIATILLSQVTLDKDGRAKARWSTAKENFANVILTVKENEDNSRTVSIDKNRDGRKGDVIKFDFTGRTTLFEEVGSL